MSYIDFIRFTEYVSKYIKGDEKGEAQMFLDCFFQALGYPDGFIGAGLNVNSGSIWKNRVKTSSAICTKTSTGQFRLPMVSVKALTYRTSFLPLTVKLPPVKTEENRFRLPDYPFCLLKGKNWFLTIV